MSAVAKIKALAIVGTLVHAGCAGLIYIYMVFDLDGHLMCGVLTGSA
nr:hypothetical protein [Mycobacterium leprae]